MPGFRRPGTAPLGDPACLSRGKQRQSVSEVRCPALSEPTGCSFSGRGEADSNPTAGASHAPFSRWVRGRLGEGPLTSPGSDHGPGFTFLFPERQGPLGEEKSPQCLSKATSPLSA